MKEATKAYVSVIIPCYRCATTIARAVSSVAEQIFRPAEVILVDDASGDATLEIINSLKNQYGSWVKVVELKKNVGAASARNAGWNLATQPYIAFLDSDDAWHPRKVEIQYGYMSNNSSVVMSGHLFRELPEDVVDKLNWPVELLSIQKVTWKQLQFKNPFVTPSVMLKKDIPFRFSEGKRYMEDYLLWMEIVGANLVVVKLNIELAAIFKPMYGVSGLSSNLWLMEKAELSNYKYLYSQNKLNFLQYTFFKTFSFIKFIRRLLIVHVIRRFRIK
ncbi:MAG: glycosyltransferase family 2 protein [Methylophilaceae bacterium]